jgi:hypothetical protein
VSGERRPRRAPPHGPEAASNPNSPTTSLALCAGRAIQLTTRLRTDPRVQPFHKLAAGVNRGGAWHRAVRGPRLVGSMSSLVAFGSPASR